MAPRFNPPPNWPTPPSGWTPPPGWTPDPSWGPIPPGWPLWIEEGPATPLPTFPNAGHPAAVPPAVSGATPASVPGAPEHAQKSWIARHRVLTGVGAVVALIIVVAALNGGKDNETRTPTAGAATHSTEQSTEDASAQASAKAEAAASASAEAAASASAKAEQDRIAKEAKAAKESAAAATAAAEAARVGTLSQQNAYDQARSYLRFAPFSRAGLTGQLTSEYGGQFPPADAEFAIARLEAEGGVDWNAEAVEAAQSYQNLMPMSRQALIDQLTSEHGSQFTLDQATHAVGTLGL
jgi:hypothetical protein